MPYYRTILQDHHGIEQQTLKNSVLLDKLQQAGKFDIHAQENRLFLPANPQFAHALGVTPHSGGPLADYQRGMLQRLRNIQVSRDGQAALEGDPAAIDRVAKRVEQLRDTVKVGLINGDLNTNTAFGQTPALTSQKVRYFFDNIPAYYEAHAHQIQALKGFTGIDHGWGAIAHSESRIVTMLNKIDVDSTPMTRGGDVPLQRSGLALAIANAHHDGRVVMSEPGIRRVELVLGEESAYRIRVPPDQRGAVSMDLLLGEASARNLVRAGGLLTTGADVIMTARRAVALLEQGNTTAAQSEFNHALARNAGGWIGGGSTALVLGGSGFLPAAVVAADALLLSKAFEKGADLRDNWAIYHQTDRADVDWTFNGRNWERQAAFGSGSDGHGGFVLDDVVASYQKSQELGAMASAKAVDLALGKAPPPQAPFTIPAHAGDRRGLDNQDWQRNADTSAWGRQVKTGVSGANDRGSYATQAATPERARQLNQEALGRIESNIASGREAIAAAYLESHAAQRAQDYRVEVPAAVEYARAKPGVVLGSDGQVYQRNDAGDWASPSRLASGNLAIELELTNRIRQPSLERSQQELADIQALPAPTAAQAEKNELLHRYRSAGIDLNVNPDTQQAIGLAVQWTLEDNGITGKTMQLLQPDGVDRQGYSTPIIHYQTGPDGMARQVAITSSDDLRQAWAYVQAQRQETPVPDSPALRIAALAPDARDAHQQALREANRQDVSTQEAQRVATLAAVNVRAAQLDAARAPQPVGDAQRQRDLHPAPDVATVAASSVPVAASPPVAAERPEQAPSAIQHDAPRPGPEVRSAPAVDDSARLARLAAQSAPLQPMPSAHHERAGQHAGAQIQDASQQPPAPRSPETLILRPQEGKTHHDQALPAQPNEHERAAPARQMPAAQHASGLSSEDASRELPGRPLTQGVEGAASHDQHVTGQPAMTPMQAGHPDHALYLQIREHVTALDTRHGRTSDETSERMTASLLVLAKDSGLDRVDHVLLSNATAENKAAHYVFVVQGEPGNPAHQRGAMPTAQAAQTPVAESLQQFDVVSQEQQRTQAQQLEQQAIQGRAISMG